MYFKKVDGTVVKKTEDRLLLFTTFDLRQVISPSMLHFLFSQ